MPPEQRRLAICPNCGFHIKPTLFGGSAPAGKTAAAPPTHTRASTEPPPDPAAARAAESAARQAATDAALLKLRQAAQSAPPTPEQLAELRAARQREADLRRGGR